jgi:hypothetical protein
VGKSDDDFWQSLEKAKDANFGKELSIPKLVDDRYQEYVKLRSALLAEPQELEAVRQCVRELIPPSFADGTSSVANSVVGSDEGRQLLRQFLGEGKPPSGQMINEFVESARDIGFPSDARNWGPAKGRGRKRPRMPVTHFASILLSAVYPDQFVEVVDRDWWNPVAQLFGLSKINRGTPAAHVHKAADQARQIASTPKFKEHFKPENANWTISAIGWLLNGKKPPPKDGPVKNPEKKIIHERLAHLADELLLDPSFLVDIKRLAADKGQVIFYGPPGTGKTYVARKMAEYFAQESGGVEIVQFHPSYAYEDFIEGHRPCLHDGRPGFRLEDGPLKRIAQHAQKTPDAKHVLLIDEINRGNIAKVFGELYYLLEYRDQKISLQYSREPFQLPRNLWFIGTMNTADRSIALIDAALRRRFFFVPFFPHEPPIAGLLKRWLERHNRDLLWVASAVDTANQRLGNRNAAIGLSYFLRRDLTDEWVRTIWKYAVLPYIAEQFFGEEERLKEFELDNLRNVTTSSQSPTLDQSDGTTDAQRVPDSTGSPPD